MGDLKAGGVELGGVSDELKEVAKLDNCNVGIVFSWPDTNITNLGIPELTRRVILRSIPCDKTDARESTK